MAHHVTAVITRASAVERILTNYPGLCSIFLRDDLHLIPLEDEDLSRSGLISPLIAPGFTHLSPGLEQLLAAWSSAGQIVYLETEYFGGEGDQAAIAFENGIILPPTPRSGDGSINVALASIGVIPTVPGEDGFEHIGLHRHRNTSDWKNAAANGSVEFPSPDAHAGTETPPGDGVDSGQSARPIMKIDASNAVKISSIGAALWWLAFGLLAAVDILSPDPSSKHWLAVASVYFGTFIGSAFYAGLTVPTLRALRQRFAIRRGSTSALAVWIFLSLLPILAGVCLIVLKVTMDT